MQGASFQTMTPLQKLLLLVCLIIALTFLAPTLLAIAALVAAYYGYLICQSPKDLDRIIGVLVMIVGGVVAFIFAGALLMPVVGFLILEWILRRLGHPSLFSVVRQWLDQWYRSDDL